jgi:hypothetical protein
MRDFFPGWKRKVGAIWSIFRRWTRKRLTPEERASIANIRKRMKYHREILASGTKMREQTPDERAATPTTFGYARYPLTDFDRKWLALNIEFCEQALRRILDANFEPSSSGEIWKKYFPDSHDGYKSANQSSN